MGTTLSIVLFAGMAAQVTLAPAARTEQSESIQTSLRVIGPLEPGSKSREIELYRVTMGFENQSYEPATLFVPHVAARAFLMHGACFKGRREAGHHYEVGITDAKGEPVKDGHFAVFVGGVMSGPEGLPKTLDYSETLDLIRLAGQDKLEREFKASAKPTPEEKPAESAATPKRPGGKAASELPVPPPPPAPPKP